MIIYETLKNFLVFQFLKITKLFNEQFNLQYNFNTKLPQ